MPELPDLTVFAESLQKLVLQREIAEALYHKKQRLNVSPDVFNAALKGERIVAVRRVGKELLFEIGNGNNFLVHLMLSGGFEVRKKGEPVSFPVLTITFRDGESLVVHDPKGMVTITLNPDLSDFAVDALDVSADYLERIFKNKPRALVKAILIDQRLIAGIGNAYSDEILWQAKISPKSVVGKIPKEVIGRLATTIRSSLTEATGYLRKNHPGMISGEVRDFLAVHNPKKKTSPTGAAIIIEEIAAKKTYYTEEQVLYA